MSDEAVTLQDMTNSELRDECAKHVPPIATNVRMNNATLLGLLDEAAIETQTQLEEAAQPAAPVQISEPAVREPADDELAGDDDPDATGTLGDAVMAVAEKILTPPLRIGARVYYWREEKHTGQMKVYPAVVTEVGEDNVVSLVAFGTPFGSSDWRQKVPMGSPATPQSWSWPPASE